MTIERCGGQESATSSQPFQSHVPPPKPQTALSYRGVDIRIAVERTPDYVFGQADLVAGNEFLGRLSIGNPKATPEELRQRLSALAQARVDIFRAACGRAPDSDDAYYQ